MNIRRVLQKTSVVDFDFFGEQVTIEYRVNSYTASKRIEFFQNADMTLMDIAEWLVNDALVSWSLNDDGEPFEITLENINMMPSQFHTACMRSIQNDLSGAAEGE